MSPASAPPWTTACASLWRDRQHFSVLHTGATDTDSQGLTGFLHLWQAWRRDPARCERLHVLLLVDSAADAQSALHAATAQAPAFDAELLPQLRAAWPPLTRNLHPLPLDSAQVQLLLGLGPLSSLLPRLRLQADVVVLSGAAAQPPAQRLRVLKAVARLAAPGALACGAASSPALLAELRTAGFQQADAAPAGQVWARHQPHARRHLPRHRPDGARQQAAGGVPDTAARSAGPAAAPPRTALVIGAGVAGAAAARALARQGLSVTVLDRQTRPAAETSGNPAALFHGTVNPDDGLYARLFRAAALVAQRCYAAASSPTPDDMPAQPEVCAQVQGLLRLQPAIDEAEGQVLQQMQEQLQRLGLPATYVQALDAATASALAGRPLGGPAWFYPGGGWVDPAAWVRQVLRSPGVSFQGDIAVQAVQQAQGQHQGLWQALDAEGHVLAQADVLVLACAVQCQPLLKGIAASLHWPLRQTRGQVTQLQGAGASGPPAPADQALRLPVAGDGYALPLPALGRVLCGATRQAAEARDRPGPFLLRASLADSDDLDAAAPTAADHHLNLQRLQRLTGLRPVAGSELQGRVGWRLHSDDRLPIAGAVPLDAAPVESGGGAGGGAGVAPAGPGADASGAASEPTGLPPRSAFVRVDQARRWPRAQGLFVLTALGARGLTLAPLLGELVAAQATGTPWPLEQELADAVDPVRWALRAARAGQAQQAQARVGQARGAEASGRTRPTACDPPDQDAG